jgi:hypothetical protein
MSRRYLLASGVVFAVVALLVLAGIAVYLAGWWPFSRGQLPPPPGSPRTSPHGDSFSARNWSYHLRPVPTEKPGPQPTAEEAWRDLYPGMAKDQATHDLLQRLYGGLPVELVVLDQGDATDDALTKPPGEAFAVALRVANLGSEKKKTAEGETLFGLIALGRATLIRDAAAREPGKDFGDALAGLAQAMKDRPSDGEAWGLAVEDYMLRHKTGWLVVGGPIFDPGKKLPKSPQEHRADLDGRIKAFAEDSADYYGRLRGKK